MKQINNNVLLQYGQVSLSSQYVQFNRPTLSANGTLGGNSFAVYASSGNTTAYQAVNDVYSTTDFWQSSWNTMAQFTLYYPQKFKGTFNVYGQCYTTLKIQGSDNNSNWIDVTNSLSKTQSITNYKNTGVNVDEFIISINSPYKYFKIVPLTTYNANAGGYIFRIIDIVFTNTIYETSALNNIVFPVSYTSNNSYGVAFSYINGSSSSAYISSKSKTGLSLNGVDISSSSASYLTCGY